MKALKVLFLDDETALCECFKELFSSSKIEIFTFSSVETALNWCQSQTPDLIFLDYRIGSEHGDKVASLFEDKIPKYLITGELDIQSAVGFKEVLPKPFDTKRIEEILREHLQP